MIDQMARALWVRPTLRPDKLYAEDDVLNLLALEPGESDLLADWRAQGVGPEWTNLPDGRVRYFGFSILAMTYPQVDLSRSAPCGDPRALFGLEGAAQ